MYEIMTDTSRADDRNKSTIMGIHDKSRNIKNDPELEIRSLSNRCLECHYSPRIVLHGFTNYICKICNAEKIYPNSHKPSICTDCARKRNICVHCCGTVISPMYTKDNKILHYDWSYHFKIFNTNETISKNDTQIIDNILIVRILHALSRAFKITGYVSYMKTDSTHSLKLSINQKIRTISITDNEVIISSPHTKRKTTLPIDDTKIINDVVANIC